MVGSIDPRCETVRGTHWPKKVAWLFGTRVAETILASGSKRPHQQAGHMDASDPIRPEKLLRHGGRPHITVAKQTLSRELRAMGYRKLSARPRHHGQAEGAIENFKKNSQRAWMKSHAKRRSRSGK